MAATGVTIDRESFSCSICLDLLKDPVTIPCGHSYCMTCVTTHWNGQMGKQSYSCPQCRKSFTQRPVLVKNTMLAVLMEGLQKSGAPAAVACPSSAAHGDVFCDLCCGKKVKAVKSCLQCLVSYCKKHLQPHYDVAALKKHKLVEPTETLQDILCSRHDEVMKMFCRTDQQCICYLCSVDQHKGHDTVTAAAERAEKQKELQAFQQNILQRIALKDKYVNSLYEQLKKTSRSAEEAVLLSDRGQRELLHLVNRRMSEISKHIKTQMQAEEDRIKNIRDKVEQEIMELQDKFGELDTLSQTEDHVQFLHNFVTLPKVSETSDSVNSSQSPPLYMDMVTAAISKLKSALQETSLRDPSAVAHKPKVSTSKTDALPAGAQVTAPSKQAKTDALPTGAQVTAPSKQAKTDALLTGAQVTASSKQTKMDSCPAGAQGTPSKQNKIDARPAEGLVTTPSKLTFQREGCTVTLPSQSLHPQPVQEDGTPPQDETLPYHNLNPAPSPHSGPYNPPSTSTYWKMKKYIRKITWDPRSLNDHVEISNENLEVTHTRYSLNHWPHSFRFTDLPQVVSKETLTGQFYFEASVYIPFSHSVFFGVAYKDISRNGTSNETKFGMNAKSWGLECFRDYSVFWHNGEYVQIEGGGIKVGVFVDYRAGILTFYRERNDLEHVYTFKTHFTRPLAAAARFEGVGGRVIICKRMILDKSN